MGKLGGEQPDARASGSASGPLVPELYRIQVKRPLRDAASAAEPGAIRGSRSWSLWSPPAEELDRVRTMIESEQPAVHVPRRWSGPRADRNDDRASAGRRCWPVTSPGGRLLLLRHQRPDANHIRPEPRRRRPGLPPLLPRGGASTRRTPSRPWTSTAWAAGRDGDPRGREPTPTSRSGCAASTVGTRLRSAFCHRIGLDYVSPARPGSRLPGWPRPRRPSAEAWPAPRLEGRGSAPRRPP